MTPQKPNPFWDYFSLFSELSPEQRLRFEGQMTWVDAQREELLQVYRAHRIPTEVYQQMGDEGFFGITAQTHQGQGLSYLDYGLSMLALESGDTALRSVASVQNSLVIRPISLWASLQMQDRYLPQLISGKSLGAFCLSEPHQGSDPTAIQTRFRVEGEELILSGEKAWSSNAPIADILIVWAKNPEGKIQGVLVPANTQGVDITEVKNKQSMQLSSTGQVTLNEVRLSLDHILSKEGLGAPMSCINQARFGVSWGALGAAINCFETARAYSLERTQFDKPIASFQLQQKKLSEILTKISQSMLMAWQVAKLLDADTATPQMVSMLKRHNVESALWIARESRQILGANGVLDHYPMMRHMLNLESVITYEGSHDVHLLITGQHITGISAFN